MAVASAPRAYIINLHMLTPDEERFIEYWSANRLARKKVLKQLYVGLPLASLLVIAIVVNFLSGWNKKADMKIRTDPSIIIVVIIAAILIVVFTTVFSVRHKWDMNEQLYKELLDKKERQQGNEAIRQ